MTMPVPKWLGREDDSNLRSWAISLLTILVAALLIAAIAEWAPRHLPAATEDGSSH